MSGTDDDQDDWKPPTRTLDADGRVRGGTSPSDPFATGALDRSFVPPAPVAPEPLELEERAPKQPSPDFDPNPVYREEPKPPFRVPGWLWAVAVLLLAAGAAVIFWPQVASQVPGFKSERAMLRISSTPAGATVKINGEPIGETPLFMDNLYGGPAVITVGKRGYRTWSGTFNGGEPVRLEITLEKQ
jgi:hypothetical protein